MDHWRAAAYARYARAVRDHSEPADADQILKDADRLWRTVRNAELAGLDGAQVIRAAVAGRPFTGARSHSAVLDARIREDTGHLRPGVRDSWSASLPSFGDPELARYMAELPPRWTTGSGALPSTPPAGPRCGRRRRSVRSLKTEIGEPTGRPGPAGSAGTGG